MTALEPYRGPVHRPATPTPAAPKKKSSSPFGRFTLTMPARAERQTGQALALTEVIGNLAFTSNTVTAWYRWPGTPWAYRPDRQRDTQIVNIAVQLAELAGHRIHLRRTSSPFPIADWLHAAGRNVAAPEPSLQSWYELQAQAGAHLTASQFHIGEVYFGVEFTARTVADVARGALRRLTGRDDTAVTDAEYDRLVKRVTAFDDMLNRPGLCASRATEQELSWLLHRSVALGLEPTARMSWGLDPGDMAALTEDVDMIVDGPYASTVRLRSRRTGQECHVAVLTVGRMGTLEIPEEHDPWLHAAERVGFPVEVSSRGTILAAEEVAKKVDYRLRRIRSQEQHHGEHDLDAPPSLQRYAEQALQITDEVESGRPEDGARHYGWHRFAVSGPTRQECLDRAAALTDEYNRHAQITLRHPKDQQHLIREFIPGEPVYNNGYQRHMRVKTFAAAVPQATPDVGDRRGDLIARTCGTGRAPVFLDLHAAPELLDRSGLTAVIGEPGSGKSTLAGTLAYHNVRRGVRTTILDPSGLLVGLARMPELYPITRILKLTSADAGTLSPYGLVPTPSIGDYPDAADYLTATKLAKAERYAGVLDACRLLLPAELATDPDLTYVIQEAARDVPKDETSTLDEVVERLRAAGQRGARPDRRAASRAAGLLEDAEDYPGGSLFFGQTPPSAYADPPLTILTLGGLQAPDMRQPPERWSIAERMAFVVMHAGLRLAVRRCYGGDPQRRKLVILDEAHAITNWPSGRDLVNRIGRDSRKFNLAAVLASQNPLDLLNIQGLEELQNLIPTVFVGRTSADKRIAAAALQLLGLPVDEGYEDTIAALSPVDGEQRAPYRQFLMRDAFGRVQKVQVDMWVPGLLQALGTTPNPTLSGAVR